MWPLLAPSDEKCCALECVPNSVPDLEQLCERGGPTVLHGSFTELQALLELIRSRSGTLKAPWLGALGQPLC